MTSTYCYKILIQARDIIFWTVLLPLINQWSRVSYFKNIFWCSILLHSAISISMGVYFVSTKFLDFRQVLHGAAGGMSPQVQARSQQLPGSTTVTPYFLELYCYFLYSISSAFPLIFHL